MVIAYIALGSNLQNPLQQIHQCLEKLKQLPESQLLQISSLYLTTAIASMPQPDFINAVVKITTQLPAQVLMRALLQLEQQQGRVRDGTKMDPRIIDLDLLLYGNVEINLPSLTIPHPALCERAFVLVPLLEITPDLCLPNGQSLEIYKQQVIQTQTIALLES